ncbi:nitrile hydratase accessory protein [Ensifer adhaerens]|uniref:nitrile hydratase accessory protein n=1 Tax=Ensifer adhaerens TaxID=106592 RepID=UPI001C4E05BD|nr:nitrile hydratase accessory protein [Ensifer adhaerens]MBW0367243.1 nitrile hydratase accessory protein [Ensifer adhaerens]UCM23591.1 nitrile hydratase accessory protein [Ensifer adhaerens]
MSGSDPRTAHLTQRDSEPAFAEPWHAQASAMASLLVASGVISAAHWSETLGAKLREVQLAGQSDDSETYYRAVLSALEGLLDQAHAISGNELIQRRQAWERAYLRTPHGQPVVLGGNV